MKNVVIKPEILEKDHLTKDDLAVLQAFGYYLGLDDSTINDGIKENNNFYREQIDLVNKQKFSKGSLKKVSTSQLRKFFGALKKIQASKSINFKNCINDIILLSPKLAYAVGRDVKKGEGNKLVYRTKIKVFYDNIAPLISSIGDNEKKFNNFINIFEAIVAFHKEVSAEN